MAGRSRVSAPPLIERAEPRTFFAELVAGALARTRVEATSLAALYLVELLEARLRPAPPPRDADGIDESLAEGLLRARLDRGAARAARLRGVGDRALFVAGFFRDSLERRVVGPGYYRDTGRTAYAYLAADLAARRPEPTWPRLFQELSDRFGEFMEVLTEVGDCSRAENPAGLEGLYVRYLREGRERDRRRLLRRGHAVPTPGTPRAQ
jgi:hypothetical protein